MNFGGGTLAWPGRTVFRGLRRARIVDVTEQRDAGSPTRADRLASFQNAVEREPDNPSAWSHLGTAYARLRRNMAAILSFEKAVALAPDDPMLRAQLADSHRIAGDTAAAIAEFQAAVRLAPRDLRFRLGLANAHRLGGAPEAGVTVLKTAVKELGDSARLQALLGDLKVAYGDFAAAAACYRAALARDPGEVNALLGLSRLDDATPEDDLEPRIEARLADPALDEDARIGLLFARANLLDRAGRYAAAFTIFSEANARKRGRTPFDPTAQAEAFAEVERGFTAAFLSAAKDWGAPSETPIFVLGMPRSGTTLVERILGAHPKAQAAGEPPYVLRLIQDWPDLIAGERRYPGEVSKLGPEDCAALGRRYLDKLRAPAPDAARIVDKNPFNFEHLGLIALVLPGARIVHCVRDAMDVCASNYTTLYQGNQAAFSYDLADLAGYYRGYERLMDHWRAVLPRKFLAVSYESLVEDPEAETRRLLEFCALPWDDRCLAFQDHAGAVLTASSVQVRRPISGAALGKWRRFGTALEPLRDALDRS